MISAYRYPDTPIGPEALAAKIEDTRAALGETMSALAAKADVKARVSSRVTRARDRTTEVGKNAAAEVAGAADEVGAMLSRAARSAARNPLPVLGAAAGAALVVVLIARGKRR